MNLSYSNSAPIGPADADILVSLAEKHRPTDEYVQNLRGKLSREFPGVGFYTLPVDIVTQILNFGLSSPIDIQIVGPNLNGNRAFAEKLMNDVKFVPGAADIRIQQPFNSPNLFVDVDRTKAQDIGLVQRDVAGNMLVALSGSFQTAPSFWLNPQNGVSYNVAVADSAVQARYASGFEKYSDHAYRCIHQRAGLVDRWRGNSADGWSSAADPWKPGDHHSRF